MQVLGNYISRGVYTVSAPFHPFGGAVDIIAVEQQDGTLKTSPWYVRFGKFQGVLKSKEKIVNITVNEIDAGFHMYLDKKGEAYFLRESYSREEDDFVFSPPTSGDETDGSNKPGNISKQPSLDDETNQVEFASKCGFENGKVLAKKNAQHSKVMGFFLGKKPVKNQDSSMDMARVSSLECAEMAADLLETNWSTNIKTSDQRSRDFDTMPMNVSNNLEDDFNGSNGNKCASDEIPSSDDYVDQGVDRVVSSIIGDDTFEGSTVNFDNAVNRSAEVSSDIIKEVVYETSNQCNCSGGKIFQRSFANANKGRREPAYDFSPLITQLQSSECISESASSNCEFDKIQIEENLSLDLEIVSAEESSSDITNEHSFNDLTNTSTVQSYPISIPKFEAKLEKNKHFPRSLPNFHTDIHYLEGSGHFDTSTHSLPLNSRILEQEEFDAGSIRKVIQTHPSKEIMAENMILNCIMKKVDMASTPIVGMEHAFGSFNFTHDDS